MLYIFIQGYRMITGQLRESMMGMAANMAKAAFIRRWYLQPRACA